MKFWTWYLENPTDDSGDIFLFDSELEAVEDATQCKAYKFKTAEVEITNESKWSIKPTREK